MKVFDIKFELVSLPDDDLDFELLLFNLATLALAIVIATFCAYFSFLFYSNAFVSTGCNGVSLL